METGKLVWLDDSELQAGIADVQIQKHDPPNDPELLAYYAAHDRHGQSKAIEVEAEAEAMHATQAAVASILNGDGSLRSGKKAGL